MSKWARYLRLNWHINGSNIAFFAPNWVVLRLNMYPILSYNTLKWLSMYPISPSTNPMSHRNGIRSSTDQKQGKIEVCSLNFTKVWVLFNYFLKLPEVRWTPEFFTRVLWVSTDEAKLFRRKNEKDFLVIIIPPVWKFGFSRNLYGNQWARGVR